MILFLLFVVSLSHCMSMSIVSGNWNVPGLSAKAYLIHVDNTWILVDTGIFMMDTIVENTISKILGDNELSYILLTHGHLDHVGNVEFLKRYHPQAEIIIHEAEKDVLTTGITIIPNGTNWVADKYLSFAKWASGYIPFHKIYTVEPDLVLLHKDAIAGVAGEWWWNLTKNSLIIHTPGHTDGSISLIVKSHELTTEYQHCMINTLTAQLEGERNAVKDAIEECEKMENKTNEKLTCFIGDNIEGGWMHKDPQEVSRSMRKLQKLGCQEWYNGHTDDPPWVRRGKMLSMLWLFAAMWLIVILCLYIWCCIIPKQPNKEQIPIQIQDEILNGIECERSEDDDDNKVEEKKEK